MGIRFLCPNGHKLNVKTFLAGKRGLCPYCGAKFLIPADSQKTRVAALEETASAVDSEEAPVTVSPSLPMMQSAPTSAPAQAPAVDSGLAQSQPQMQAAAANIPRATAAQPTTPQIADPFAEAPNATWYVRLGNGSQYGPARGDEMRQWVDENRVTPDSLVWREGWPDWKRADETFPRFAQGGTPVASAAVAQSAIAQPATAQPAMARPAMATAVSTQSDSDQDDLGEDTGEFLASMNSGAKKSEAPPSSGQYRKKDNTALIVVIILVVLALGLGVFAVVAMLGEGEIKFPYKTDIPSAGVKFVMPLQPVPGTVDSTSLYGAMTYKTFTADARASKGYMFKAMFAPVQGGAPSGQFAEFAKQEAEFAASDFSGASITDSRSFSFHGSPAEEFSVSAGGTRMRIRVYLINNTSCILAVVASGGHSLNSDAVKEFFNRFDLRGG